jgi:hypothetical protein
MQPFHAIKGRQPSQPRSTDHPRVEDDGLSSYPAFPALQTRIQHPLPAVFTAFRNATRWVGACIHPNPSRFSTRFETRRDGCRWGGSETARRRQANHLLPEGVCWLGGRVCRRPCAKQIICWGKNGETMKRRVSMGERRFIRRSPSPSDPTRSLRCPGSGGWTGCRR